MEKESEVFNVGSKKNFILPGNPRYQPQQMKEIFGYDNLYRTFIEVELATLDTLYEFGVIPQEDYKVIEDQDLRNALLEIPTKTVDDLERSVTKHDIRALVQIMQKMVGPQLGRWIHVPLTSYDVIDTGRSLQYLRAFQSSLEPSIKMILENFRDKIVETAPILQVGRTHGQHALPITVGFWLATIAERIFFNYQELSRFSEGLLGKISGAVGAYNAQVGLALYEKNGKVFEEEVLKKLGLTPAPISTQILPPEPLAYFLFSALSLSASLGQLGRDGRNLMRSEIGEVAERFSSGQVGSSTMAHKRNPINFENLEGMWLRTKNEFGKVMDTMISDHQRDLVGSSVARDLPIILINLQQQLNTLLRPDGHGENFFSNIIVDKKRCEENFSANKDFLMAEPIYIALQMAGYQDDAHHLVNHVLMGISKKYSLSLFDALLYHSSQVESVDLQLVVNNIPQEVKDLLSQPEKYIGLAPKKALLVALAIDDFLEDKITN